MYTRVEVCKEAEQTRIRTHSHFRCYTLVGPLKNKRHLTRPIRRFRYHLFASTLTKKEKNLTEPELLLGDWAVSELFRQALRSKPHSARHRDVDRRVLPPKDHKPPPHEPDPAVELLRKQLLSLVNVQNSLSRGQMLETRHNRRRKSLLDSQLDALRKELLQQSAEKRRRVKVGVKDPFRRRPSVDQLQALEPGHPDAPVPNGKVKKGVKRPPDIPDLPEVVQRLSVGDAVSWMVAVLVVGVVVMCIAPRQLRRGILRSIGLNNYH